MGALGGVAIHKDNDKDTKPGTRVDPSKIDAEFMCVHESLVCKDTLSGKGWSDKGSHGDYDGSIWFNSDSPFFQVSEGHELPHKAVLYALSPLAHGIREIAFMAAKFEGKKGAPPFTGTFKMERGLSHVDKEETSAAKRIAHSVSQKFTLGFSEISSSETEYTFEHETTDTITKSIEQSVSLTTGIEIQVEVPPGSNVVVWQQGFVSSQNIEGFNYELKSMHYIVETST